MEYALCVQALARNAIPGFADCIFLQFEAAQASALALASGPLLTAAICEASHDCLSPPACCDVNGLLAKGLSPEQDDNTCSCSKPGFVRKG